MPLYEYYCEHCEGVYEAIRPIREASMPVPCPVCSRDGERIMSSFAAFVFRDGYPRRIPDRGTYWHFGQEVKERATRMVGLEHPELAEPKPAPQATKGDAAANEEAYREWQKDKAERDSAFTRRVKKPKTQISPTGVSAKDDL